MDNTDTCRTKKMDANKVWQWRIMHVKKYSRRPDPFYFSNRIGLDFNVASSTQKKLDLQLVTNGVILEICNFAKIVNKSKRRFLTNILENNFDLGFENEQQRIDFSARIHYKVKELIRKPPKDKNEVFTLFDTSSKAERNSNYGLTTASSEHLVEMDETDHNEHEDEFKFSQVTSKEYLQTEGFSEEMDEAPGDDFKHEDEFKCSQVTSKEYLQTEGLSVEVDKAPGDDSEHEDEFKYSKAQSAEELQEDCLPPLFPYCEGIGLNLDVGSKQSLDPDLLTKGVMLELVHFTRILTASYSPIVLDVLEHNFELDLKSQQGKSRLWFKISHLLRRRNRLLATGTKISRNFKDEQFSFQTNPLKRTKFSTLSNVEATQYHLKDVMKRRQSDLKSNQKKRALSSSSERANKRHRIGQFEDMETNSLSHHTDLCTSEKAEGDHCHTFLLGESDQDSDKVTNPGYTGKLDHLQSPKSCSLNSDIAGDSEPSYLAYCTPLFTTTEISSSSPTVHSNVNPPFASQPEERGLCGGEEPSQTPRNASNKHDMEQDEMGTEIMWKLRANRVKQILSSPKTEKDYCQFTMSKKAGLEFNVGFGLKKTISVDSLSNSVLLEVAKFALAMNSSQQDFIMEILEYNFDFGLQSQHQRDLFTCEIMKRVRKLRSCEDAVRFSKEIFQLPGPMSSKMNMANQSVVGVTPELSSELRIKECAVVLVRLPHSHAETKQVTSQKIVDLYPFCKEIGLKLHVNKIQPNKKLDINNLTNGAMTEVMNFAEKLCGTFEQICLDILRHNLDLDSQSGQSDLARDILAQIPAIMEQKNLSNCASLDREIKGTGTDYSTMLQLDCQNSANLDASSAGPSEAATIDQYVDTSADIQQQDEHNLMLWKLRATYIEYILSVPHEEHCPFYSYSRCKKIGIDFNVGSGIKQNLDPKLLTNGIMVELNKFATALLSSQRYFITDILEYNFHLDFKNELHRSAFATQTWYAIQAARKKFNFSRINMLFELPDLRYIQESAKSCPRCYQVRTDKLHQDESDAGHMHHPRPHTMTDTFLADANSTAQKPAKDLSSTLSAAVETIIDRYSRCKKIGLDLCVDKDQPKYKVDLHLLTHGIINEVFNFTIKLCGTKNKIINDVLEHNFKIGMQRQDINPAAMFLAVLKKYKKSASQAWLSEVYVIQHYPQKQFRHASKVKQATSMRRSELKERFKNRKLALQSKGKVTAPERMGTENYYTCPLGESDLDWGDITDSGGEEQTQTLRNEPTECDMEQEEMGTETLWKLRANRVKQILSSPNRALGEYSWSKRAGLEFNVGFGPKQHISVDSLTNSVLLEVAKFALAMNSSQQDFIMEILEYNFDFGLQSQHQRDLFICEIMKRVRNSRSCEDAVTFSKEYLHLPGPMSSVNMANQSMGSVNPELSSELRVEDCDVASVCPPNLNSKTKEHISQKIVDLYPFCKKIGLKLHVNKIQPNKKLDINNLTNGAMTEVMNFAEKLCGTFEQICLDILRHNLDLDSQSGQSDLARDILAQIPAIMEQKNLSNCAGLDREIKGTGTDCSTMLQLDCQNSANLDASNVGPSEAATIDQYVDTSADIQQQDEHNLMLWKLRATYIEYILSVPHEEHCPFYSYSRCKKIGIDFNVGSGIKQNLDPKLLTNGIMVELTKFATALLSSQRHFITDILEYNFHLDFKNELHRSAFATQTWYAIQAARKKFNFSRINMLFELPDLRYIEESAKSCPRCYQVRTDKLHQDESDAGHMHHPRPHTMTDTFFADANSTAQKPAKDLSSTLSAAVETIIDRYSRCKKIGLDLCIDKDQPKDKVDLHLLTHGIITEVFNFTIKLCGTKNKIINDVLEHNFKIGMQRQDINPAAMFLAVLKKYKKSASQAWLSEVYVIQHYPQKQFRHASKVKQATSMRRSELKERFKNRKLALQSKGKVTAPERMGTENYYTCPLGESDLDWGDITDSGGEEQTQTLRNEPTECDMEQEEMGTETLWKLRANHVKQILSSPNRALGEYSWSKRAGLEFNVGFGPKQHISVDSLTNSVLLEVAKFALAMNSSQQDFIMEILEYNFDFGLQSQHQRDLFICEIMKRVRNSRSCEDAVTFSKEYLQLPGPMSSVNMANQSMGSVNPNLSSELRVEDCDVASVCPPNLNSKTKEHISQKIVDLYPFCKKIGLKLHVNKIQPNKKLDINNLTNGAMTEVMNFAEKLCGTFEQICLDILRHNLDLDSQSGHSDLARDILAQIPAIMEQKNLSNCAGLDREIKGTGTDYSTMLQLDCQNSANLDANSAGPSEAATIDQYVDTSADIQQQDEHNLMLWKLRARYIEYILSVPHEEHCPFYSYSRCKKIGIDFNVGSGIKQNLDPKLLTNGIMVELNKFATALLSSQRYFITDILEYNFYLDFKNELHRSAFATQTWYAIQAARKKFNFSRINMLFELPDLGYIEESAKSCPRCYQVRTDKLHQDESDAGHMHHPRPHTMTDTFLADANSTAQKPAKDLSSTLSAAAETIIDRYSHCKKIGLDLCVDKDQPKDKVDLHLLTHGIINEVFNFTIKLCGTKNKIINDVLEHNFKIGMQRQDINPAAMFLAVLKKYKKSASQAWLSEVYVIQHYPQKQFRHASKVKQATSMRRSELKERFKNRKLALQSKGKVTAPERMGTENYYTCPLGESDLDWGDITDSGGEEQTQTLRNEPTECDMEQEEMGTETLWKLRANRVKQILSSPNRALGEYSWSKKAGLEFNVGFGPKQHISVDSLTNSVLLEVAKFALAMNSSQQDFIMEILEYNFDFGLQSQHQRDLFICEIMKRVRNSRSCGDAVRFSKEYLQLPGPMSSVNMANQSMGSVNPELSSELRVEDCDVASVCPPNLNSKTKEHISQKIVDLYPFCKKIGLKLHVNKIQPNKKLDINNLTNGAMTEVMNFAEKLCGTFEQICLDILRHNLDLDSQSGQSDLARDILAQIPAIMEQKNLSNCAGLDREIKGTGTDCSTMLQLDCQNSANLDASNVGPSEAATIDQYVDTSADIQQQDEHNLMLWKLRATYIEYILSVPHEEHCPFYSYSRCKKIGIDFNVGSGIKQNLDPKLLTNGIMVELTKFATALLSSQRHFITDILEYNFHLDFKNELHRSAFATQTWYAIQAARKKFNFSRINMLFELPDLRYIEESAKSCPRCYQVRTDKLHQDESDGGHMHHPRPHTMTDTFFADANSTAQKPAKDLSSTLSAAVETIIDRYSRCKKIGLDLCIDKDQPKDKVDLHLLTHGIITEVFNFTIKLCGTKNKIINDVLEHNFKIGMQRQDINPAAMFLAVLKKYKKSASQAWLSEVYVIQHYPQKQFRHASKVKQATSMRRSELKERFKNRKLALQSKGKVTAPERMGTENYYTCPLGESDLDWGDITDSGGEEQTQTLRNEPTECDMEQEEMGTETLWKLRANHVKQILSSPNRALGEYSWSKRAGLEFNVGFGPKQHISVDSLTNSVLLEVAKFALAMNSSQQDFIMEILEYNFDFGLQSQHQRDLFICEIMKRVRNSRSCEDAVTFSKEYLQLPGPMSSVNMANQSMGSVNPNLSSELRVEDCDVASVCPPNLNSKTKEHISQKIVDLYPFCKKIGLKLHVNKIQPNKKLDINNLTNGAMTEVMNFAEKLCGTFEQICLDILRHNLDLDLQSGHSDLARDILAQIPAIMEQKNLSNCASLDREIKGTGTDYSTMLQLDCQNSANLDASSAGPSEAATIDQYVDTSADIQQQDEHNLMLWKLRATYIEYILSVPHEEHCPFYSYSRCKKIGIDFNVGSGIKQNLDPKLLTNGIMVELNKFATALLSSQRYFITDILEYNFHLDFKNELHRSAFATQTWYAIQAARKKFNFSQINMLFELPDLGYIEESAKCCPRCYQVRTDKLHKDESDGGHMHHPRPHTMTDTFLADANSTAQKPAKDLSSTLSAAVETIIDRYSRCKKIGLDLCVDKDQPKYKVDLHLLTHGIITEVFNFTIKLCGTKNKIINDVLEHNFKIGMQRQDINPAAMFLAVLKKYKKSASQAWLSEVYVIQQHPQKQFRHASKVKQATSMRKSELKERFKNRKLALQSKGKVTAPERMGTENYYTCPLGESDLDWGDITDSGGEEQTQTLRNEPTECDMEQEEMGTETLWKLRANRVKQILSSPNKEFGKFTLSKRAGMKFNVGFGPKQHISVDSLTNSVLLEVAKFALAMNSSQQDFIMEILEYNFDFGLQSQHQRDLFTCEIMKRVRKLRSCEDAVRFSKEVFEFPGPMLSINMPSQSMVSVNSELGIESRMEECDVAPVCPSDSHTESKEHISEMIVDPHPFCKEIGLKLHVNNRKQNTKLDINKLTNGAMTEVTNFAEQLCGTFEQICLDILRHNFDFNLQSGDTRRIVAAVCEQKNLSSKLSKHLKIKGTKATNLNQDCQNDQTLDASGTGYSQAAVMDDKTEYPEELDLKLWKLRANQMQQILSIPHGEHCPLYSYPRCKTLGIDFNVGSGVKQNLDPKLLTNGIMVEVDTFANALHSAEKYFITEILEYNFHLDFKSELHRSAFTLQIWKKVLGLRKHKSSNPRMNMPFELPDIQEPISDRPKYCPKCYQDRNDKLHQDESNPSEMHHPRPHIMLDTVSANANCIEQKPAKDPSLTSSATEETIMDRYPRCKKIGLNLCVNKDQPKDKLDMHVLTSGIIVEVASFAKKLCGSKLKTICAIIENNFNMSLQPVDIWNKVWLSKEKHKDGGHAWLDEVCVFQPQRQPRHLSKLVEASATQISERKETIKKRMLALQTKEKRPTLPSPNTSVVKSKTHQRSKGKCFPHCTEIGLDLDVTSKSGEKEKLDLDLLTRAVVCEIHKFAVKNPGNYMPHTLFDILDYNFDLSSQHHRRWEFSIATTSKVQAMVKQRDMNRNRPHEVFRLPFIFAPGTHNEKPKKHSRKEPVKKRMGRNHSDSSDDDFLNVVETDEVAWSFEDTEFSIDPWSALPMCGSPVSEGCDSPLQGNIQIGEKEYDAQFGNMNPELDTETVVQMSGSPVSEGCGSPLPGNAQIKEEYNPHHGNIKPEPDTEEKHNDDVKTKSNTEDAQHLVPDVATGLLGYMPVVVLPNLVGPQAGLQNQYVQCYILAEPQGPSIRPDIVSNITPRLNTEGVQYLVPVQAVGCPMVTIGPGSESILIKQGQENVPADLQQGEAHRK